MCNINKNHLLTLYFQEGNRKEVLEIKRHVKQCRECRDYLATLGRIDQELRQWQDVPPRPDTLDLIMDNIPVQEKKQAADASALAILPVVIILLSILAVVGIIYLVHQQVTLLPFWDTLKEWWPVRIFGSFGVTTVLFFLFGIFVTLSLAPVLIMELQSKKYTYKYN